MVATDIQSPDLDQDPVAPSEPELADLKRLAQLLMGSNDAPPTLVTVGGEQVPLPPTLLRVLRQIARMLAQDNAIVVEAIGKRLTPHQAAVLIGVPLQHVTKLLDAGELPFVQEGIVQLLTREDVLAYRGRFMQQRREALREMTRLGQQWGMYDIDPRTIKLKRLAEFDDEDIAESGER